MKITYISHAALLIEVDGLKIVTDPWLKGSSYCEQWFLFPKPTVLKRLLMQILFYTPMATKTTFIPKV